MTVHNNMSKRSILIEGEPLNLCNKRNGQDYDKAPQWHSIVGNGYIIIRTLKHATASIMMSCLCTGCVWKLFFYREK